MNVAVATSTVSRPFAFMTPRGSDAVDPGAGTRTPTSSTVPQAETETAGTTEPLVNRFPTVAFSYDTDASRLVMLYRDPANGKTVSQIPTEAALKQYKEAQQQEKDAERASLLKLTVGESGQGGQAGGQAAATLRPMGAAGPMGRQRPAPPPLPPPGPRLRSRRPLPPPRHLWHTPLRSRPRPPAHPPVGSMS
ncbi:hypothetical protein [Azospirillum palustre]